MKNENVTVILPIHSVSGNFDSWFKRAIKSVEQSIIKPKALIIVCADNPDTKKYMDSWEQPKDVNLSILYNDGKTDYCGQINYGVDKCETDYFSILEFDDEYSNIWFKNVKDYMDSYTEIGIFLPLVLDVDVEGNFINFTKF